MRIRLLTSLLAVVMLPLTGCQSVPMGDPARSAELKQFAPKSDVGQIYVCRDPRIWGAGVTPTIELDGKALADLKRNTYFYVEVPAGDHTIIAKTFEHDSVFPFTIAAGEQMFFQTWISVGVIVGRGLIDTIPQADGKNCVREAELVGALAAQAK